MKRKKINKHEKIRRAVLEFYYGADSGFTVVPPRKLDKFIPDILAVKDQNDTEAVEVKPSNDSEIRKGVGQAYSYMGWVHKVYLVVPEDKSTLVRELLKYTPIGILLYHDEGLVSTYKEAESTKPDPNKLIALLNDTIGFCWLCGRTFNVVPRASENMAIPVAYKGTKSESKLFKALEKYSIKKVRTKNIWIEICCVCSKILGEAIHEYFDRVFGIKGGKIDIMYNFKYDNYLIEETRKLLKERGILK